MSFLKALISIPIGAAAGVAAITALPVLGVAGVITTTGVSVGTVVGGTVAVVEELSNDSKWYNKSNSVRHLNELSY